ncbi:macro domain-like protein [Bimuria novae-zelandiae CBS 107.79]|uniref:Macro domain-like protein n=1 Tax=Bimuria novae-zelandiae CBS 107.79 TaxID=1447943 RepID=A0A6A5VLP9_9PLEO|nr:macro domain-like protein [Bimuria novae-zelandiae CBS 107.79]
MADVIQLDEIPTLSLLYKLNRIPLDSDQTPLYPPNAAHNDKISIIKGDITVLAIDAIVNAANEALLGGGGVDGAIHRAAGPDLYDECLTLGGCEAGDAKISNGYELPSKKIIHAVGPRYYALPASEAEAKLKSCYRKGLELAVEHGQKSIAFPAISTGVFSYPNAKACNDALGEVRKFLDGADGDKLERVIFCNFLQKDQDIYYQTVSKYFPPPAEAEKTDEPEKASTDEADIAVRLPDAPTTEPQDPEEPSAKKQKTEEVDDFVVVAKEDAKDHNKGEL